MRYMKYIVAVLACAGIANASVITPSSITFTGTGEIVGAGLDDETNIINGNGLSGALTTDADLLTVTHAPINFVDNGWTTTDPGGFPSDYFASTVADLTFGIDLGGSTQVGAFASWGYSFDAGFNGNQISSVRLDFSSDGTGTIIDSTQTIAVPLGATSHSSTVVALPTLVASANYITMTVLDNHYGAATGGDRVGLAEVRFSTEAIPEPATLGLVAVFGGAVLFIRRKLTI